jgi:hypothetical protein
MPTLALAWPPRGLAALLAVTALSLAACGGGGSDAPTSTATGAFVPAAGTLGSTQTVVVVFSASMRPSGATVGGSLGANALSGWTTSSVANDTLVLTPSIPWAPGAGTLTVSAADAAGLALPSPLQVSYMVVPQTAPCSAIPGDCNNATDCGHTMAQLAGWTQTCFIQNIQNQAAIPACVEVKGVTAACSSCITGVATCGFNSCASSCLSGFTSATCTTCLATSCTTQLACLGRTL